MARRWHTATPKEPRMRPGGLPADGGRRWRCRIVAYLIGIRATQGGRLGEGIGGRVDCVRRRACVARPRTCGHPCGIRGWAKAGREGLPRALDFVQWVGGNLWCVHPYPSLNNFFFSNTQAGPARRGWCGGCGGGKAKEGGTGREGWDKIRGGATHPRWEARAGAKRELT